MSTTPDDKELKGVQTSNLGDLQNKALASLNTLIHEFRGQHSDEMSENLAAFQEMIGDPSDPIPVIKSQIKPASEPLEYIIKVCDSLTALMRKAKLSPLVVPPNNERPNEQQTEAVMGAVRTLCIGSIAAANELLDVKSSSSQVKTVANAKSKIISNIDLVATALDKPTKANLEKVQKASESTSEADLGVMRKFSLALKGIVQAISSAMAKVFGQGKEFRETIAHVGQPTSQAPSKPKSQTSEGMSLFAKTGQQAQAAKEAAQEAAKEAAKQAARDVKNQGKGFQKMKEEEPKTPRPRGGSSSV